MWADKIVSMQIFMPGMTSRPINHLGDEVGLHADCLPFSPHFGKQTMENSSELGQ
jgi:hypothetical protein